MTIEEAHKNPYVVALVAEGWAVKEVRDAVLDVPLTTDLRAALGHQFAVDDAQLAELRQSKNAKQAALMREKKNREGAVSSVCRRIADNLDEIGLPLNQEQQAAYADKAAALRRELDEFEAGRKETLSALREELKAREEAQQKIAATLQKGKGPVRCTVVDLADYPSGLVRTIRWETGEQTVPDRPLDDHERQLGLFGQRVKEIPMTPIEWTLATSGRIIDAGREYAARTGMAEHEARKAIRAQIPESDLPPDDAGIEAEAEEREVDTDTDTAPDDGPVDHKLEPTVFSDRLWTVHLVGYEAKMGTKLAKKLADVMGQKLAVAKAVLLKVEEYARTNYAVPKDAPVIGVHVRDRDLGGFQLYITNAGGDCFAIEELDANNAPIPAKQEELWPASRIGKEAAAGES